MAHARYDEPANAGPPGQAMRPARAGRGDVARCRPASLVLETFLSTASKGLRPPAERSLGRPVVPMGSSAPAWPYRERAGPVLPFEVRQHCVPKQSKDCAGNDPVE